MNIYRIISTVCVALFLFGCTQDDRPGLDAPITDMKIIITPGEVQNTYTLTTNPSNVIGNWTLGNGMVVKAANTLTASYPFKGNYTITLSAYGQGGKTNTVQVVLPVLQDNYNLVSDPYYELLTGGLTNRSGKTWVIDSMLTGYIVLAPAKGGLGDWSTAPAGSAGGNRMHPTMFDDQATFVLTPEDGPAFRYINGGTSLISNTGSNKLIPIFMANAAWKPTSYQTAGAPYNSDQVVACTPPSDMTWVLIKGGDGNYSISLPSVKGGNGGFLGLFTDWDNNYDIKSLTKNRLVVWKKTTHNNGVRQFVFIVKGTPSGLELGSLPESEE